MAPQLFGKMAPRRVPIKTDNEIQIMNRERHRGKTQVQAAARAGITLIRIFRFGE